MRSCVWNSDINPRLNHAWAAKVLSMYVNSTKHGPDLLDETKFVEVKNGLTPESWTFSDEQIAYGSYGMPCYLLGLVYRLAIPIEKINIQDVREIERMVVSREASLVGWDYVVNLDRSKPGKNGHVYRYPRPAGFPPITASRKVTKGIVNFHGIDPSLFGL